MIFLALIDTLMTNGLLLYPGDTFQLILKSWEKGSEEFLTNFFTAKNLKVIENADIFEENK
jgi:hypothetical protein